MQFNDRTTVLQEFTRRPRRSWRPPSSSTEASGPTALHNAPLRRAQGPGQAEEGRRAAAARDRAALGRRGHRVARDRRAGPGAGAQDRDRDLLDQPAAQPRAGAQPASSSARPCTCSTALSQETGGQVHFPELALGARHGLRPHRRGAAHASTAWATCRRNSRRDGKWRRIVVRAPDPRRPPDPPQDRLLRAAFMSG